MSNKIFTLTCGAATLALGFVFLTMPAHAGFQWVAPTDDSASQTNAYAVMPSVAVSGPEAVSPIIISGSAETPAAAAESASPALSSSPAKAPVAPTFSISATPTAPEPTTLTPPSKEENKIDLSTATISVAPPPAKAAPEADVVRGFASQVPLALALRQLLPSGYSFSIDPSVDMDTLVSYKGGKPWGETLKSMLAAVGLVDHEQGLVVTVSRAEKTTPPSEASKAPAPQPVLSAKVPETAKALAAPAEVPVIDVSPVGGWSAERGDTLRKVLTVWCGRAGIELKWLAEYDYPIEASAHFNSSFEEAVRDLLAGFDNAQPQPIGELHANSRAGQKVLVIQTRGNSYSN
jgi:hypothetical protein